MRSILTICRKGLLVLVIVLLEAASQAELLDWKVFTLPFSGNDLVFANNQFLAASQQGIFTSPDGVAWTQRSTNWADYIGAGGGKYVAIRASKSIDSTHFTTPAALASSDGINWSQPLVMTNSSPAYAGSVCYGNGLFLTAGTGGRFQEGSILVSADGTNWTQTLFGGLQRGFTATAFGNGVFSVSSFTRDLVSSDGTNWTSYSNGMLSPAFDNGLTFGNNEFVEGNYGFRRSSDGITWSQSYSLGFQSVIYGDGKWVVCYAMLDGERIGVSSDLNDWTIDDRFVSDLPGGSYSLAYGNGRFVILTRQLAKSLVAMIHTPPRLALSQTASNHLALTISGEVGKTNSVETSSNLVNWAQVTTFLQSNYDTSIVITNPFWSNTFFRTVSQ